MIYLKIIKTSVDDNKIKKEEIYFPLYDIKKFLTSEQMFKMEMKLNEINAPLRFHILEDY